MRDCLYTETQEHSGLTVLIEYVHDYDHGAPWVENDGHGDIRECSSYYGHPEKRPGEVVLHSSRGHYWIYDFAGAMKTAKADGWGLSDEARAELARKLGRNPTNGEIRAASVRADMEFCAGWLNDSWSYVGIICTVLDAEGEKTEHSDSCWGFETYKDFHKSAAREMAGSLALGVMNERSAAWRAALKEARARRYWAARDVQTVEA